MRLELDQFYVAESKADFKGWEILSVEDFKPGVKIVYMRYLFPGDGGEFRKVYCQDEFLPTAFREVAA